ncbi:MAG: signal peptidase I [Clostridia bacterium]|nr:signal peptidase I [Clostridia bacterium]
MSDKNNEELTTQNEETEKVTPATMVFEWTNALITALIIVLLLLTFVFRQVTVNGTSMTDTLKNGDRLIVSNFMYTPKNNDIVVISHGNNYSEPIIKRVIATEGQSLSINYDTGDVVVDGVLLDEPYIKGTTKQLRNPLDIPSVIPEGYVFVMGDNREGSLDSRSTEIGLIPVQNIIGKAEFRMYPFDSFGNIY